MSENTPPPVNTPATPEAKVDAPAVIEKAFDQVTGKEQAPSEPAPTKEPPKEKKKYKLKLEGKETELEVSEDDVPRYIQKGLVADKKFNESAAQRKAAEELKEKFKTNPFEAMAELGLDPFEAASEFVVKEYEKKTMTPEQQELMRLKKENEENKKWRLKYEQEQKAKEQQEKAQKYAERYNSELEAVLTSGEFPQSRGAINSIVEAFQERLEQLEDEEAKDLLSIKDVLPDVKEFYETEIREAITHYSKNPTELKRILGPEIFKLLREMDIAEFKAKGAQPAQTQASPQAAEPQKKLSDFKSWREWNEYIKSLK